MGAASPQNSANLSRTGRKPGSTNKVTRQLKDMILTALDRAGGVDYLERQAEEEPKAFLALVGKVLPLQLTGEGGGPVLFKEQRDAALAAAMRADGK